jgi:hypothetical protein
MIITYCFIGPLPDYAIDTVHQVRLFYKGIIYFIVSDIHSPYIAELKYKYDVTIIDYNEVIDLSFNQCINQYFNKFLILNGLKGREKLFIYSFERFFLLYHLMNQYQLSNVFFLELDNLIYDDPLLWEKSFAENEMSYMYDSSGRCASGICFIKNKEILLKFMEHCKHYIATNNSFLAEMFTLYEFWEANKDHVQLLPIHWPADHVPKETHMNYDKYQNTIFDAAALGIYLGGLDPFHTDGVIVKGQKSNWSAIDYTKYQYIWQPDDKKRNIPYVLCGDTWIKINNLHIHSKNLKPYLSNSNL